MTNTGRQKVKQEMTDSLHSCIHIFVKKLSHKLNSAADCSRTRESVKVNVWDGNGLKGTRSHFSLLVKPGNLARIEMLFESDC